MRKAFTLTELLLAAIILAVVLSAILLLFMQCIILNEFSRSLTVATAHGQYVMEEIKNSDFSTLESEIDTNNKWDWSTTDITNAGLTALANESIDVSCDNTDPQLLDIEVTVSWQDKRGRAGNLALKTLIAEP